MQCLWLTREFPDPPNRGDLVYTYHLVRSLAAAGAELTVLCLDRPEAVAARTAPDAPIEWRRLPRRHVRRVWSLATALPSDSYRTATVDFRRELERLLAERRWDAVILDHIATGWALEPVLRWRRRTGAALPIVYVSANHESSLKTEVAASQRGSTLYKSVLRYDAYKFARLEGRIVDAASLVTAITEEDAALYRHDFPHRRVHPLPPGYDGGIVPARSIGPDVPRRCVHFGSLDWIAKKQNMRDFIAVADDAFAAADIGLDIVGTVAPDFETVFAGCRSVRLVGRVPDGAPHLAAARIGLMIDRVGGGFKLKHLDYVFHRLPTVSMRGQTHGLNLDDDTEIKIADDYAAMVDWVKTHIDDFDTLNDMQNRAFEKARARFDWSKRGREFYDLLAEVIETERAGAVLDVAR
jgi:glycosyltransferase involved in cell wall biosynthesis